MPISCRDPALEAALSYTAPKRLDDILFEAVRLRGIAGARQAVKGYLTETRNRYQNVRVALPRAAEMVFHAGHKAEAVIAANAVAEALPDTVDAWVVLAYVALQNGEKSLAKTAAQRAIGLDPNQRTARELLEQASAP